MKTKAEKWIERGGLFAMLILAIVMLLSCAVSTDKCYNTPPPPELCQTEWSCDEDMECCQAWSCDSAASQAAASDDRVCNCYSYESCTLCAMACVINEDNWTCFDCEDGISCWPCFDGTCMRNE